jgi:CBS domain-containing protein
MSSERAIRTNMTADLLTAPARQVMKEAVTTCLPYASLKHAFQLLRSAGGGALPIVDAEDKLVGILTERDLCEAACLEGKRFAEITVQSAMTVNVKDCSPDDSIAHVLRIMNETQVHEVPVVDPERRVLGIVDVAALASFVSQAPERHYEVDDALLKTIAAVSEPPLEYCAAAE